MLATDIIKLAENYLNLKLKHYEKFKNLEKRALFNYYAYDGRFKKFV